MGWLGRILLYLVLIIFIGFAGFSILFGRPRVEDILPAVLFGIYLFAYPRLFDKLYERGGTRTLILSSIEMATLGIILGLFLIPSFGFWSPLFGALGVLLTIQSHEIGHFVFSKKYNLNPVSLPIRKVFKVSYGITLAAVVHKIPNTRKQDAIIVLAGPLVNLILTGTFWGLLQVITNPVILPFIDAMYTFNRYFFLVNILFEGLPLLFRKY